MFSRPSPLPVWTHHLTYEQNISSMNRTSHLWTHYHIDWRGVWSIGSRYWPHHFAESMFSTSLRLDAVLWRRHIDWDQYQSLYQSGTSMRNWFRTRSKSLLFDEKTTLKLVLTRFPDGNIHVHRLCRASPHNQTILLHTVIWSHVREDPSFANRGLILLLGLEIIISWK